jgi:small GTP-binding protein
MPTNLPPEYFKIDKRFREAETAEEKIELLEELISVVPKHKGTDHLRADLRRRLSKLREEEQRRKPAGKRDSAFRIPRAGAGQVVVIGPANTGKSALVSALTGAEFVVSEIPYTTWEPAAGMMVVDRIPVQLVDTPPLSRDLPEPRMRDLIRNADMILMVVDLRTDPVKQLLETAALLEEYRIIPLHLKDRYTEDHRLVYLPLIVLVNKCDDDELEEVYHIFCELMEKPWPCMPVSAVSGRNLDCLSQKVVEHLDVIRVYTRPPGGEANLEKPFVLKKGSTIDDLAGKIHRDIQENMKTARVWGENVHDGQMVQRDYVLQEGDIVEIVV